MKTLVFQDSTGLHVELLTDLIGDNKQFTVYQIQERVDGVLQIGLTEDTIAKGFDFTIDEYDTGEMIAFAEAGDYTLTAVETGHEDDVLYQGSYYGGAIGVELL